MGFFSKGVCYQEGWQAMQQWLAQYPYRDGTIVYSIAGDTAQQINYDVANTQWSYAESAYDGTALTSRTMVVQFPECRQEWVPLNHLPQTQLWFVLALVFAALIGFRTGFRT